MAPVIASTDMPMVVAVPWKIRSEAARPGDSFPRYPRTTQGLRTPATRYRHPNRPLT